MNPENQLLEKIILRDQSRSNTDLLVEILNKRPELFPEFWKIMLKNSDPLSRRAAWAIDYYTELHTEQLDCRIEELVKNLIDFSSDGLKRHSLRMLSRSRLPVDNLGILTDLSFKWLQSKTETVAVKVYCMQILQRVAEQFPELISELIDIIQYQMDEATPAYKSIANKILKNLNKEKIAKTTGRSL